jgi:surface protein
MIGVTLTLYNHCLEPVGALTDIQALWWDVSQPMDGGVPVGEGLVSTDADGVLSLDLSAVSSLDIGADGFLQLYQLNTDDHTESLTMATRLTTENLSSGQALTPVASICGGCAWVRPADWLSLPAIEEAQGFIGLKAVFPGDTNLVALSCEGNYAVDWGDGSGIQLVSSGVKVEHEYGFAALSTDTLSARGYKQVLIKILPQTGQDLTEIDLRQAPTAHGTIAREIGWLDMRVKAPNLTVFSCYRSLYESVGYDFRLLERIIIEDHALTSFANIFRGLAGLRKVTLANTENVTTFTGMFLDCTSLCAVDLFDTSGAVSMASMFYNCVNLKSVPLFDTSSVTDMSAMFYQCEALVTVPLFDTSAVTTMYQMFWYCYRLKAVPLFDTSAVVNMGSMFYSCYQLTDVPLFDTSSVTDMSSLFVACYALPSVPLFDTSAATTTSGMFSQCASLVTIPAFDLSAMTVCAGMFMDCTALAAIPALDFSNADLSETYYTENLFSGCKSLARSQVTGIAFSHSYEDCHLSAVALNEIFTNLPAAIKTITVTGNYGISEPGYDATLATINGWTVTA